MLLKPRSLLADRDARMGLIRRAREPYHHLLIDPSCPTVLPSAAATGLGTVGDTGTALAVCRELTRPMPSGHEARFGMACSMYRLGHPAGAIVRVMTQGLARAYRLPP